MTVEEQYSKYFASCLSKAAGGARVRSEIATQIRAQGPAQLPGALGRSRRQGQRYGNRKIPPRDGGSFPRDASWF